MNELRGNQNTHSSLEVWSSFVHSSVPVFPPTLFFCPKGAKQAWANLLLPCWGPLGPWPWPLASCWAALSPRVRAVGSTSWWTHRKNDAKGNKIQGSEKCLLKSIAKSLNFRKVCIQQNYQVSIKKSYQRIIKYYEKCYKIKSNLWIKR